jgi:hypothetical protein
MNDGRKEGKEDNRYVHLKEDITIKRNEQIHYSKNAFGVLHD